MPKTSPEKKWNNFFLFWKSLSINKKNKKGNTKKPMGKIKKGGNKSEDDNPQIINLKNILKLYNFFYF